MSFYYRRVQEHPCRALLEALSGLDKSHAGTAA
jgi:hypothetical protein